MPHIIDEVSRGLQHELDLLWRFALKLTVSHDDAADLVQRTCLRALEQRDSYRSEGKLRSWLFRIEHRIWLNELRSRQIRNHRSFTPGLGVADDALAAEYNIQSPDDPETFLLLQQVATAVESLPEAQRLVMVLVNVEGFSYREAADILDTPIGTVMSRLARARIAVGKMMLSQSEHKSAPSGLNEAEARK